MERKTMSFRVSMEVVRLLEIVAERHGLTRSAAMELMVREGARRMELLGPGRQLHREEEPRELALAGSSP